MGIEGFFLPKGPQWGVDSLVFLGMRMNSHLIIWAILLLFIPVTVVAQNDASPDLPAAEDGKVPEGLESKQITDEQYSAVFVIAGEQSAGTGFGCLFRDQEWVSTNLHVVDGPMLPKVTTIGGKEVALSGKIIYANDVDLCLLGITGNFKKDYGVTPLEFAENAQKDSAIGDAVVCPGNSLGNGVITLTQGEIKAIGGDRMEISNAVFPGNSGGPVIHVKTGKVLGLVTLIELNAVEANIFVRGSLNAPNSALGEFSYIAMRMDTVKSWGGCSINDFFTSLKQIDNIIASGNATIQYLKDEKGWESDAKIVQIDAEYNKFLGDAERKTHASAKRLYYVDDDGIMRSRLVVRSKAVSQADYEKALRCFEEGIAWKIESDMHRLGKVKPFGHLQSEAKKQLQVDFKGLDDAFEAIRSSTR